MKSTYWLCDVCQTVYTGTVLVVCCGQKTEDIGWKDEVDEESSEIN